MNMKNDLWAGLYEFYMFTHANIGILHSKMAVSAALTVIIAQLYAQSLSRRF